MSDAVTEEVVSSQEEYDREQLESVAEELREMANSLSGQTAIDPKLSDALHTLSGRVYDSLPHEVVAHRYPDGYWEEDDD